MSNLKTIRELLIDKSGRLDLNDLGYDEAYIGNLYVNAGHRLLDSLVERPAEQQWYVSDAVTTGGEYIFNLQNLRSADQVWVVDDTASSSEQGRFFVEPKETTWMLAECSYGTDSADYGIPTYWSYIPIGLSNEYRAKVSGDYTDVPDTGYMSFGNYFGYDGVLVSPACQADLSLRILGTFYDDWLTSDTATTFWITRHPQMILLASLAALEAIDNRNTSGYNDYLNALQPFIRGIEFDAIQHEMAAIGALQMGDSWSGFDS